MFSSSRCRSRSYLISLVPVSCVLALLSIFSTLLSSDWRLVSAPHWLDKSYNTKHNVCFIVLDNAFQCHLRVLRTQIAAQAIPPCHQHLPLSSSLSLFSLCCFLLSCNWALIISMPHCDKLVLICRLPLSLVPLSAVCEFCNSVKRQCAKITTQSHTWQMHTACQQAVCYETICSV